MSSFGKIVAGYIFNDEMKAKLIAKMNENVDIPIISEKTEEKILVIQKLGVALDHSIARPGLYVDIVLSETEEKILTAIWDSVEEVVKEALIED